jgi:long-chain acyl-CoA synthetase
MKPATTLPRLLHRNASGFGARPALREKRGGIWQVLSWSEYAALVARFAAGLAAHGFGRGDRLAVIGDNRPRLYAAMLAAQSLGGAAVPLWPDAEPDWIAQVVNHASMSMMVAEDAEQVDKIVSVKDRMPGLRLVVQTTSHGMRQIEYDWLKSFERRRCRHRRHRAQRAGRPGAAALWQRPRHRDAVACRSAGGGRRADRL